MIYTILSWFFPHSKNILRKLAKDRLIRRYEYLSEVTRVLEEYVTKRILDGGSEDFISRSRNELLKHQAELAENQNLLDFLKDLK